MESLETCSTDFRERGVIVPCPAIVAKLLSATLIFWFSEHELYEEN